MGTHFSHLALSLTLFLLMWVAFTGWGWLTARLTGMTFRRVERPFATVWLGWAASILLLQLWHLAMPVDALASFLFVAAGSILAIQPLRRGLAGIVRRLATWQIAFPCLTLVVAGWLASRGMLAQFEWDSGAYHFNMVRWINEYRIVPGLGNLNVLLASNQTFFLQDALWDFYPFYSRGYAVASSFLFMTLTLECLFATVVWFRSGGAFSEGHGVRRLLPVLMLPVVMLLVLRSNIGSPSPDAPSFALQLVLFLYLMRFIIQVRAGLGASSLAGLVLLLAASMTTVKLSSAAYALLASIVVLGAYVHRHRTITTAWRKPVAGGVVIAALIICVWMARGVIWSGYLLFPSRLLRVNVEWALPPEMMRGTIETMFQCGRWLDGQTADASGHWLTSWARVIAGLPDFMFPLIALAAAAGVNLWLFVTMPRPKRKNLTWLWLGMAPALGALAFWLCTAPAPRFGLGLIWVAAMGGVVPLVACAFTLPHRSRSLALMALFLAVNLWPILWVSSRPVIEGAAWSGYYPVPVVELRQAQSRWGVRVYVPASGEQCWDSPLPSAPRLDPNLALRGEELKSGFVLRCPLSGDAVRKTEP